MKSIAAGIALLFICQLGMNAMAGEKWTTMENNTYRGYSNNHPSPPKISFVTSGVEPVAGWLYATETDATLTQSVKIDGTWSTSSATNNNKNEDDWYTSATATNFSGGTPGANQPVQVRLQSSFGETFYNDSTYSDGWVHVRIMYYPGYKDNNGVTKGAGYWLGWEDWPKDKVCAGCGIDDFNDMDFILQGVIPQACDGTHCVDLKAPVVHLGNRMIMTGWREEDKF